VGTLAGELKNPTPHAVSGFVFHPGFDSPGHDIANLGRDIPAVAARCLDLPDAIAFNTDGFAKRLVLPRSRWLPIGNGASNEGLYIKKRPSRLGRLLRR
jgi:hypothetical protein